VKHLLKGRGGLFVLAFTVRLREILQQIHSITSRLGFKLLPINYNLKNSPLAANFGFKMILVWEVPSTL
jgi:hypothetical protein